MSNIHFNLQTATSQPFLPKRQDFKKWLTAVLADRNINAEIGIRLVDAAESAALNKQYRHKAYATNVLSFPYQNEFDEDAKDLVGDLVICASVVIEEAQQQQKDVMAHWAHLVIHGTLHLIGYDHESEKEAEEMENLEIAILEKLNYPNPYLPKEENHE